MVLSGPGLSRLFAAVARTRGRAGNRVPSAAEIVEQACAGTDDITVASLTLFCHLLATVAANAALTVSALGGVYVAGGIVRRFPPFLIDSGSRQRFEYLPQAGPYPQRIETSIVTREWPELLGAYHLMRDAYRAVAADLVVT